MRIMTEEDTPVEQHPEKYVCEIDVRAEEGMIIAEFTDHYGINEFREYVKAVRDLSLSMGGEALVLVDRTNALSAIAADRREIQALHLDLYSDPKIVKKAAVVVPSLTERTIMRIQAVPDVMNAVRGAFSKEERRRRDREGRLFSNAEDARRWLLLGSD